MVLIAPSVLSADFARLGEEAADVERGGADFLHFDVMDGLFVPNLSVGLPVLQSLRRASGMFLDVHLMIDRPVRYVERFCDAGADLVSLHVEADTPENIRAALEKIRAKGKKAGLVLKPKTPAEAALPYLGLCDLVLVMTVEPGFGGQSFMAHQLAKVTSLRKVITERNLPIQVEVDGGIGPANIALVRDAGANVFVAGSSVFSPGKDPAKTVESLLQALN